jgi:hypothetical protein
MIKVIGIFITIITLIYKVMRILTKIMWHDARKPQQWGQSQAPIARQRLGNHVSTATNSTDEEMHCIERRRFLGNAYKNVEGGDF